MSVRQIVGRTWIGFVGVALLATWGCSGEPESKPDEGMPSTVEELSGSDSAPAESPAEESTAEAAAEEPAADEPEAVEVAEPAQEIPAEESTPEPEAASDEAEPANDEPVAEPASEGEMVAVADTKPGLTRIGATKCKMCHKIQYNSWLESAHAERTPPLDCESCHGSGSEYKKKSIMEDPELARAAGLVIPDATFCKSCHDADWDDSMLMKTHAHKEDETG